MKILTKLFITIVVVVVVVGAIVVVVVVGPNNKSKAPIFILVLLNKSVS